MDRNQSVMCMWWSLQMFSTPASGSSKAPVWSASRNLVLQKGEATVARIAVTSVVKSGRVRSTVKRQLVGCAFCALSVRCLYVLSVCFAVCELRSVGGQGYRVHATSVCPLGPLAMKKLR